MLPRTYDNQVCSVARTLERIGDRWTMLIIRDAFLVCGASTTSSASWAWRATC